MIFARKNRVDPTETGQRWTIKRRVRWEGERNGKNLRKNGEGVRKSCSLTINILSGEKSLKGAEHVKEGLRMRNGRSKKRKARCRCGPS